MRIDETANSKLRGNAATTTKADAVSYGQRMTDEAIGAFTAEANIVLILAAPTSTAAIPRIDAQAAIFSHARPCSILIIDCPIKRQGLVAGRHYGALVAALVCS